VIKKPEKWRPRPDSGCSAIGRLKDPSLLLKIPVGTRKNFSENYQQMGHALKEVRNLYTA
jgi:hypothetical protein